MIYIYIKCFEKRVRAGKFVRRRPFYAFAHFYNKNKYLQEGQLIFWIFIRKTST